MSKPPLAPLNIADKCSLKSANNNRFQTITNLNATANPTHALHQPHTAPKIGPCASVLSLFSVPTVNLIDHPPVITQNYTKLFIALNKSLKSFD